MINDACELRPSAFWTGLQVKMELTPLDNPMRDSYCIHTLTGIVVVWPFNMERT